MPYTGSGCWRPKIVVIGGSAGGVQALKEIVRSLPDDLPRAIFVVLHTPARQKSYLADIFEMLGKLCAKEAAERDRIEPGQIYVAPPDHHVLIAEGHIQLSRGPKERLHRPSINVTSALQQ